MAAGGPRDGLVCRVDEVMVILHEYAVRHRADHPISEHDRTTDEFSADKSISFMMGLAENGFVSQQLARQKYISFDRADRMLTAIGQDLAFHDGRVRVIPNPNWTQERWLRWKEEQGCI